jgi:cysteine desulfurase / selenocysteine lyase
VLFRSYRALVRGEGHRLRGIAAQRYWHAHEKVAGFIGGESGITVFVKNLAEAMEIVIKGISWHPGDRVIVTALEHQSSLNVLRKFIIPGIDPEIIPLMKDFTPDLPRLRDAIRGGNARMVIIPHISDVFGSIIPLKEIAQICKEGGVFLLVDGSQSVSHIPVDVNSIGADFFCFSGHTTLAPTGTGVLWIRDPGIFAGKTPDNDERSGGKERGDYQKAYELFESGVPNIAGGIGLGAAVDYLQEAGMGRISQHDRELTTRLIRGLQGIGGVKVYAPEDPECRLSNVSFTINGIHPLEVVRYLDKEADILVTGGTHDSGPLMDTLGLEGGTVRASIGIYNNETDIDTLIAAVGEIARGI